MNKCKRIAAVIFGVVILVTALLPTMASAAAEVDFTISNPYKNVNWNTNEKISYKANLHCHTWASDGKLNVNEMTIEFFLHHLESREDGEERENHEAKNADKGKSDGP